MLVKMSLLISLTIVNLITNTAFADDVTFINKGTSAPYDGYLFTPEKTNDTRKQLIEGDLNKNLVDSYSKTVDLYKTNEDVNGKKLDICLQQNDKLAQATSEARNTSNWEKIAYFGAGILLTGLAIKYSHDIYQ